MLAASKLSASFKGFDNTQQQDQFNVTQMIYQYSNESLNH